MNDFTPIDITQVEQTLKYCQQRIETIVELIVKQHPTPSSDNLLALLSTIHDVFDTISETTNMLESSLNGVVGCVDMVVLDVQIALQVLVEAFISNCDVLFATEYRPDEAIVSAVYCLSTAIKTLLASTSDVVEKAVNSSDSIDANVVTGLQMVDQTIINIVDRVLYCLKSIQVDGVDLDEPSLEKFSLIIQRLASQQLTLATKISPMIISPISELSDSLKSDKDLLSVATKDNVQSLLMAISSVANTANERRISTDISSLSITLHTMIVELSHRLRSIQGITVADSIDVSLQNLVSTIKCLTYYVAVVTEMLTTIDSVEVERNLQSSLCFVASSIQTLVDGVIIAMERSLVNVICLSPTMEKTLLGKQLFELQELMEPIILMLENVIKTSIELVQKILALAASAMDEFSPQLIRDMNMLVNNLRRIVKEIMESALITKEVLSNDTEIGMSAEANENLLSVCAKSFEGVAHNSMNFRVYFNNSIDQIRKYLIEM